MTDVSDRERFQGALVHGLRHTYATEPANSDVSVYTLMKLLGHESMATSQRYVAGAVRETRTAAAQNPLYVRSGSRRFLPDYARPEDTLVVCAIDRLGRSVAEVTRTIAELAERRITLRALREGIDTATPTGRAVAAIRVTLAELELELGRERRAASRESRRARCLPPTKPPKLSPERQQQLRRLAATGEPIRELAKAFGIGRATAYRYLSTAAAS